MSKTLKLDTLKSFKPSGINVDKSVIDSALKEFHQHEEPIPEKSIDKDLEAIKSDYERKIALLEKRVKVAESKDKPLSKNEEKLLSAIRSERINQGIDEPIIGRNMLIKKYKINNKYLDDSIKSLEHRGLVQRVEIPYSSNIMTNSWKLL